MISSLAFSYKRIVFSFCPKSKYDKFIVNLLSTNVNNFYKLDSVFLLIEHTNDNNFALNLFVFPNRRPLGVSVFNIPINVSSFYKKPFFLSVFRQSKQNQTCLFAS